MKVKMLVSYDGTSFGGWQRQRSSQPTIQGSLEGTLTRVFNQPITICGSGRTDAGVHARGQVAHFVAPKVFEGSKLLYALNSLVAKGIVVQSLWEVPNDFHAMNSAQAKTYIYELYQSPTPCPFKERFSWWRRETLNLEKLNRYSEVLLGRQDFKSFQNQGSPVPNTVREILKAHWMNFSQGHLTFQITGNGFLRQMVRNIVGTLLHLHDTGASPRDLETILKALDRQSAEVAAPPHGLFLDSVSYPPELDSLCRRL